MMWLAFAFVALVYLLDCDVHAHVQEDVVDFFNEMDEEMP